MAPCNLVIVTSASAWRGSGVSFTKIARGLADRTHRVLVVATDPSVAAGFAAEAVSVTKLELRHTGVPEISRLRGVLARHNAHVVMADTPRDLRLSVLAGLWVGSRIVYRYNQNHRRPRKDLAHRLLARRLTATIYQSDFIEREARAEGVRYGGRSFRIPNGFDTGLLVQNETDAAAFRNRFGLDANDAVVLTAGKLVPEKRVDRGIQALARVRLGSRALIYVLCGDGPDEPRLRELADREGLRLLITRMIDQKSLRGAYSAADLVLHTSKEIFGNVVGEAMSCGRTVICTREGAAPEVVGEAGILIGPNDNEALTSTVTSLLEDPARRASIGAAARRRIEEVFPLQRMISGYEDMLATVLAAR